MLCREHMQEVNNHPRRSKWSKAKDHCQNFSQCFETCALKEDVPDLIKQFSRGPNVVAKRYLGISSMDIDSILGSVMQDGKHKIVVLHLLPQLRGLQAQRIRTRLLQIYLLW